MIRKKIILAATIIALLLGRTISAEVFVVNPYPTFDRNLTIGSRGDDVRALQEILNKNNATLVAKSGPGSPGQETNYFGPLTKAAVIKFQELYADEILRPVSLNNGTGYVGQKTRNKLNSLAQKKVSTAQPTNQTNGTTEITSSKSAPKTFEDYAKTFNKLTLTFLSQNLAGRDQGITIYGSGFEAKDNVVNLGTATKISGLESTDNGTQISFTVPNDFPYGKYDLFVTNGSGTSNSLTFIVFKP